MYGVKETVGVQMGNEDCNADRDRNNSVVAEGKRSRPESAETYLGPLK